MVTNIPVSPSPEVVAQALDVIAEWFQREAADAKEDAEHWNHVVRSAACREGAETIRQLSASPSAAE